ncbi:MAG: hypothetical protein RR191_02750 [Cetobacterium sp.]
MKILEIKSREFKIGIQVEHSPGGGISPVGSGLYYEIFENLNNTRLLWVINLFIDIFSGIELTFKSKKIKGSVKTENRIELLKFKTILETVEKLIGDYPKEKISELKNNFYTFQLFEYFKKNESIETWMNLDLENQFEINPGDVLDFRRSYKVDIDNSTYNFVEKIQLLDSITENEIKGNRIKAYRKLCKITFE